MLPNLTPFKHFTRGSRFIELAPAEASAELAGAEDGESSEEADSSQEEDATAKVPAVSAADVTGENARASTGLAAATPSESSGVSVQDAGADALIARSRATSKEEPLDNLVMERELSLSEQVELELNSRGRYMVPGFECLANEQENERADNMGARGFDAGGDSVGGDSVVGDSVVGDGGESGGDSGGGDLDDMDSLFPPRRPGTLVYSSVDGFDGGRRPKCSRLPVILASTFIGVFALAVLVVMMRELTLPLTSFSFLLGEDRQVARASKLFSSPSLVPPPLSAVSTSSAHSPRGPTPQFPLQQPPAPVLFPPAPLPAQSSSLPGGSDALSQSVAAISLGGSPPAMVSPPSQPNADIVEEIATGVGIWGGSCTCPNGKVYQVTWA